MLIDHIIEQTNNYILNFPKETRKRYGQFFTSKETAIFMCSLFNLDENKQQLKVLDPGAGSGILSCAFVERIVRETRVQSIELICYETDEAILQLLYDNLQFIKDNLDVNFSFEIINENGNLLIVKITGDGFLRNMVRIIVGSLIEVGRGKKNISDIEEMLNNPCKSTRRYNIVPYGLYLARINYN